jgi:Dolichyl-phosphate-mannose-protein mannosyltransferase
MKAQKRTGSVQRESKLRGPKLARYWYYGLILLVIVFFSLIRIRLRNMPLERDEGEYAYAGQLILQGVPPYQLAYNMKLPGTYAAYAVIFAVLGETPSAVHLGLLLVNALTTFLVFLLAKRLAGWLAGLVAGATYALLSSSPSVMGLAGHATHFVVLFAVDGLLLLLKAIEERRLWLFFWSGVSLGLAFLMKQPGMFFVLFGGLYLARKEWARPLDWRGLTARLGTLLFGALLPFAVTCLILSAAGVFKAFWFWTFSYAWQYASSMSTADGLHMFGKTTSLIFSSAPFIWIIALLGIIALCWRRDARAYLGFVTGFLFFSCVAVCPGLYFRSHYFILMLPAVALLVGIAVASARAGLSQLSPSRILSALPVLFFVAAFAGSIVEQRAFFFELDPLAACQILYRGNPFAEALPIAEYLKSHSSQEAQIAVFGSEPEIYFYARRHSATGYIYAYPLVEKQKYAFTMQQEMIGQIEKANPEFVVYVKVPLSWMARTGTTQVEALSAWADSYLDNGYTLVGTVDILSPDHTEYRWGQEANDYQPRGVAIQVFKRKS